MKIKHKITFFILFILVGVALPLVVAGYITINQIVISNSTTALSRELNNIDLNIRQSHKELERAGLLILESYVEAEKVRLLSILRDYEFGETGLLYILDQDGHVIQHKDYASGEVFPWLFVKDLLVQKKGSIRYGYKDDSYFAVFLTASHWNWLLVLSITESELFASRNFYIKIVLLFFMAVFGIVMIVSTLLAKSFRRDIDSIIDSLKQVERGIYDIPGTLIPNDELGAIQRGVNSMISTVAFKTRELEHAKEAAEAASRAKSEFLSSMSHELRTPLNAIMGYAQILKREGSLTDKQIDQVDTIYDSGKHLLTLISDILDLSRIEAEKMKVEITEFDLPELIRAVLSAIRIKAREKNLAVQYEEGSAVPSMVKGDGRKLQQVLLNLMDNAVKYTESGGVTLRVRSEEKAVRREGEFNRQSSIVNCQFQVADTGMGIPGEKMEEVFKPFMHMEDHGRAVEGIGLGLAICRRLVELMGGKLLVESEVGRGSTFTVELSLEVVEEVAAETIEPEKVVIGYTCREPSRTKGELKRIIIADDNITNLSMLVSLLEPLGFEIETAENGEEFVGKAVAAKPDLVLLDLFMPVLDGDEALRRIRKDEGLKAIRVIGVSAAVADKARVETFAADCDDFVSKPVDTQVLIDKIAEQLQIEWIEEEYGGRGTKDEEGETVKVPPRAVLEEIVQRVERGEYSLLAKILDELEKEDATYSGFCNHVREHARRYDDEGIIGYIKSMASSA